MSSIEEINKKYHDLYFGDCDTPYGVIPLDSVSQLDLYRGAIGAMRVECNTDWTHPVKLKNGTLIEMSAPVLLLLCDLVNEHLNSIKRAWHKELNDAGLK
jgi:hypothetical protein